MFKSKHDKPHKKHDYKSVDAATEERGPSFTKRGAPELVINEAPHRPPLGGKGVEDDTRYRFSRQNEDDDDAAPGSRQNTTGAAPAARPGPGKPAGERARRGLAPKLLRPLGCILPCKHACRDDAQ